MHRMFAGVFVFRNDCGFFGTATVTLEQRVLLRTSMKQGIDASFLLFGLSGAGVLAPRSRTHPPAFVVAAVARKRVCCPDWWRPDPSKRRGCRRPRLSDPEPGVDASKGLALAGEGRWQVGKSPTPPSSRPCKYVLNTLMQAFQLPALAQSVAEPTLRQLAGELLLRWADWEGGGPHRA